jgi:uncharacterized protein YndB with AHSA1/START domain
MNAGTLETADTTDRELVMTRLIDAPRTLAFALWTDPTHVAHWWGPKGCSITVHEMDVRPGGIWRYTMHIPDGSSFNDRVTYMEIAEPERLVYSHGSDDDENFPPFQATITFTEEEGKTRITMKLVFVSVEECEKVKEMGAIEGGNSSLDSLEEYLTTL